MKKVLFIIPSLTQTNGVAAFLINYFNKFDLNKFQVEVICHDLRPSKTYLQFLKDRNIKLHKLPYVREVGFIKYYKEIKKFFKEHHEYDLVYSNLAYTTYFFYSEAKKYGITNFAIHAHATKSSDNKFKNILGKIIQAKLNKIASHKFACSNLAGKIMFKDDNFIVINNAIDYNKYQFNKDFRIKIRNRLKISDDVKILGFVGRYTPQKNVFFFIELIKKMSDEYKLLMIGNGPQKDEFIKMVKKENMEERFIFIEETASVYEYYSAFDYFLLPSLYEGLPVVGVEAQANGLPCIFSDTISDECKISNNTMYLDKNNYNDWIFQIKNMKRAEHLNLNDEFNIDVQAKEFEKIIENICK